jgi:hypothetical protein
MSLRSVPVHVWQFIDGTLDNVAAVESEGGDLATEAHATALREAGWSAIRGHNQADPDSGWPPSDAVLMIGLSASDEQFISQCLRDGQRIVHQTLAERGLDPAVRQEQEADRDAGAAVLQSWQGLTGS